MLFLLPCWCCLSDVAPLLLLLLLPLCLRSGEQKNLESFKTTFWRPAAPHNFLLARSVSEAGAAAGMSERDGMVAKQNGDGGQCRAIERRVIYAPRHFGREANGACESLRAAGPNIQV